MNYILQFAANYWLIGFVVLYLVSSLFFTDPIVFDELSLAQQGVFVLMIAWAIVGAPFVCHFVAARIAFQKYRWGDAYRDLFAVYLQPYFPTRGRRRQTLDDDSP